MMTNGEWKDRFREDDFILRNKTDHRSHIITVTDLIITRAAKAFWQKLYNVNAKKSLAL